MHSAIGYAIKHKRKSVTLVHKGNIMKFTEGASATGATRSPRSSTAPSRSTAGRGARSPKASPAPACVIKDAIADITLQQVLTRPEDFDVIATLNLNGDYLSDALAAQVGGIGIAPGGNINYVTGHAVFEATHGTAPKYANQDVVNPGSVILSGVMMLEYMSWQEAADLIVKGLEKAIGAKTVTYDFERLMERREEGEVQRVRERDDQAHGVRMSFQRRKVLQVLLRHGAVLLREGAGHTILRGPSGRQTSLGRHPELNRVTAPVQGDLMKVLHVKVEQDDGWFIAQGLEEPGVITQGRTLDEIVANVREVVLLMFDQKLVDIELLLDSKLKVHSKRSAGGERRLAKAG